MRYVLFIVSVACLCCAASALGADQAGKGTSVQLDAGKHVVDLTQAAWEFHAGAGSKEAVSPYNSHLIDDDRGAAYKTLAAVEDWKPISVGKRWERLGHPELNGKTVWLRLRFYVPAELKGCKIGFFCTAIDDAADFYLNGTCVGTAYYRISSRVAHPTTVDLTPKTNFGGDNLLVIRVRDGAKVRGGGILGNVCLYKTLPFERTKQGGIVVAGEAPRELSVLLHLGDAILCRGERTSFSSKELRELVVPPSILREDELILVAGSKSFPQTGRPHKVDLDNVNPTADRSPLALKCGALPGRIGQYELLEIPLQVSGTYKNPFDPRQINVLAIVETPSGRIEKVAAFFSQDFTRVAAGEDEEILLPKKGNPWKLYYRPRETGAHKVELFARDKTGTVQLKPGSFEVTKSARRGFLRISKHDSRFFEFDNGESFFGTGPSGWFRDGNFFFGGNTRWVTTRRLDDYYQRKGSNGCSYEYFAPCFFGKLYLSGGFIDQHVAWKIEHSVRTMEKHGLYWIVFHDDIRRYYSYGLDTLPYSEAQGGPCRELLDLYSSERALQMQKDQLRYLISRTSDSPAVWLWNCGDEHQPGERLSKLLVRSWMKELHGYIRANDVYRHPCVIGKWPNAVLDGTDVALIHDWYYHEKPRRGRSCDRYRDAVSLTECLMDEYKEFNGPIINPEGGCAEWNGCHYISGEHWDFPEAVSFHNHLWISLFLKSAAGGTEWLCNVIDRENQLFHAGALQQYLKGESLTKPKWQIQSPQVSDGNLRGFVLQSDAKCLVWVQNKHYTWYNVGVRKLTPEAITGASITVPVRKDGAYRIQLWDTRSGKVVREETAKSVDKKVTCRLPDIEKDVVLKVIQL